MNMIGWVLAAIAAALTAVAVALAVWLRRALGVVAWLLDKVGDTPSPHPAPQWAHLDGDVLPETSWVKRWLSPGDETLSGGIVPDGQYGVRLLGDVEIWDRPEELGRLGDALAARFDSPRVRAVADLAAATDNIVPGFGIGFQALACSVANRLAQVFALSGHLDSAVNVIAGHALDDAADEEHFYINQLDDPDGEIRDEAATVYVRRLMGQEAQPWDADAKLTELEFLRRHRSAVGHDVPDHVVGRIVQLERELGIEPTCH